MNSIEQELHYRINDVVLIDLSYLSMIIENLEDVSKLPARFNKDILNKIDASYKKEAVIAYNDLKKQITPLYKKWQKMLVEADEFGEDYTYEDRKQVYDEIVNAYKEKVKYMLSKINLTYDDFKSLIKSPA